MANPKAKPKDGCVKPAKGPILKAETGGKQAAGTPAPEGGMEVIARVGKPAPDFEAAGYLGGGFKNFKLSSYKGKWVVLCFYPGDFTFV